jgi:protocatechuate 3,4-dioxygenase beta subunit
MFPMSTLFDPKLPMSRREAIALGFKGGIGAAGLFGVAQWLAGCATGAASSATVGSAATSGVSAGGIPGSSTVWASGGTAAMRLASYPDPSVNDTSTPCTLYAEATEGPCYASTLMRQDIAEGYTGLPVRLSLRVLDEDCQPVEGATVDVWHTNAAGVYSAMAAGTFCNPTQEDLSKAHFGRGVQTTDAKGRVDFNTVFPGWYSGRTIHIHFRVRIGETAVVTSQLFFDDTLTDDILTHQIDYSSRTQRNTTNKNDGVLPKTGQDAFMLATARMTDGVLQAWKSITVKRA